MLGFVKMCGVSAVLSFTLVTGYNELAAAGAPSLGSTKTFHQRLGETETPVALVAFSTISVPASSSNQGQKGDRLAPPAGEACSGQTWPYLDTSCVTYADGTKKRGHVRYVTVESREGVNVSVLHRSPQTDVALR